MLALTKRGVPSTGPLVMMVAVIEYRALFVERLGTAAYQMLLKLIREELVTIETNCVLVPGLKLPM